MSGIRIRLYEGRHDEPPARDADVAMTCAAAEWERYRTVRAPGFDGRASVDITTVWADFHRSGERPTRGEAIGYETIVKFGDTKQLETRYTVFIDRR